jgi:hypothetical protein
MMSIDAKGSSPSVDRARSHSTRRPMIDAMNGRVSEPFLKSFRILAKIMEQASQFAFGCETERAGKLLRQPRDVAKML